MPLDSLASSANRKSFIIGEIRGTIPNNCLITLHKLPSDALDLTAAQSAALGLMRRQQQPSPNSQAGVHRLPNMKSIFETTKPSNAELSL